MFCSSQRQIPPSNISSFRDEGNSGNRGRSALLSGSLKSRNATKNRVPQMNCGTFSPTATDSALPRVLDIFHSQNKLNTRAIPSQSGQAVSFPRGTYGKQARGMSRINEAMAAADIKMS
jgi:hypothetical protein